MVKRRNGKAIRWFCLLILASCSPGTPPAQPIEPGRFTIIPWPASVRPGQGTFELTAEPLVTVPTTTPALQHAVAFWLRDLRERQPTGAASPTSANARGTAVQFKLEPGQPAEGYRLNVGRNRVEVVASTEAGLFYGLQTLRQLVPLSGAARIPIVEIEDAPRFAYRGLHLDVSRHFFPVAFVKKYIDFMAFHKLNTFHWHLTEDQGWRLEIKQYPRLTEVGSCRRETMLLKNFTPYIGDGIRHCGYYTQDEAREIVEYAKQRFITVIPEIEMPGHAVAALTAYPEFACTPGPFEVATRWGVFDDIFCPKEATFAFLENVLDEVTRIFPSRYVHIGGDEVPKKRWQESDTAQAVMRREGLKDEHELQSYFIRRIEKILNARGRRLIGWDEILEGGLAPDATVMSWRGIAGGIAAAKQNHDVIMTPSSHLYFDHYQGPPASEPLAIGGNSPLAKVYAFEPVPTELTEVEARHILGAQANVWTEYIADSDHVEYMVFPRLLALSEVVWSPKPSRDWESFLARTRKHVVRLERMGVRYRPL